MRTVSRESLLGLFVERSRVFLHVVLAFSPIGSTLRTRLRKFPPRARPRRPAGFRVWRTCWPLGLSLVNCCTIDWFSEWPLDGLRSVAKHFLGMAPLPGACLLLLLLLPRSSPLPGPHCFTQGTWRWTER